MTWQLRFEPKAEKAFLKLEAPTQERIELALLRLLGHLNDNLHPLPGDVKPLKGSSTDWRLRVSDWRVLFRMQHQKLVVLVVTIGHRSQVYEDRS